MLGLDLIKQSRAYQEAVAEGRQEGLQEGRQEGQREFVENLLRARFGSLDEDLASITGALINLPPAESAPLLLQLSREELLARFRQS